MTFDQIGGLDGYIDKLKEMIFLPLVYPELFEVHNLSAWPLWLQHRADPATTCLCRYNLTVVLCQWLNSCCSTIQEY